MPGGRKGIGTRSCSPMNPVFVCQSQMVVNVCGVDVVNVMRSAVYAKYNRWGGASVMVWAGISFNHKSPLVVINVNITARRYIDDVLDSVMVLFPEHQSGYHSIPAWQRPAAHCTYHLKIYMQQDSSAVACLFSGFVSNRAPVGSAGSSPGTLNQETGNSWWLHCRKSGPIYRRIASDVSFAQCAGAVRHVFKHTVAISHTDSVWLPHLVPLWCDCHRWLILCTFIVIRPGLSCLVPNVYTCTILFKNIA